MIEEMVDIFSGLVQLLIFAILALGGYLGYAMIPDAFYVGKELIELPTFMKILAGAFIAGLAETILLGPALVLLDMRNAMRSIDRKMTTGNPPAG